MLTRLKQFLMPPVFPDDEEKTRVARLLNIILLVVMGLVVGFSIPAVFITPSLERILVELLLLAVAGLMFYLMRRGQVRQAGMLLSAFLLLAVTLGTYQSGGFRGSTMSAYFGIILIAGMLVGHQTALVFGGLSILFTGSMVYADSQGWLPASLAYATQVTFWLEFSSVMVGVTGLLSLVMTSLERALRRARQNERALAAKVIEAEQATQAALEASQFKTSLIARISHELRTPLGVMLGMAEMLNLGEYGQLNQEQQRITERLVVNSTYLERTFSELLEQSQIEMGQVRLVEAPLIPRALLDNLSLAYGLQAEQKGLTFNTYLDPKMPAMIWTDPYRIEQILINLIANALKFTPQGSIQVQIYRTRPQQWCLQVDDTGIGIAQEALTYIFEPFRQQDESISRRYGGVGLGLSIVGQLASAMGGTINVKSQENIGSSFALHLPLKLQPEAETEAL